MFVMESDRMATPSGSGVGTLPTGSSLASPNNYPSRGIPAPDTSMGMESSLPLIPYYQLWFGNFLLNSFWMRYITSVSFTDTDEEASYASIEISDKDYEFSSYMSNVLVKDYEVWLYMGYEDHQRLMLHGKISDLAYTHSDDGTHQLTINIVDTSYEMNTTKKSRSWKKTTSSAVVQAIADAYGYTAQVQDCSEVKDQISQDDETDIALLKKLADDEGYLLYVFPDKKMILFGEKFSGLIVRGILNYKKDDFTILGTDISLVEKNKKKNVEKDGKKSKNVSSSSGKGASSGNDSGDGGGDGGSGGYSADVDVSVEDEDDGDYVGVIGRTGAIDE